MNIAGIRLSLILTGVLIVSAFMPMLNVLILLLNGGIVGTILYFFDDTHLYVTWVNLVLAIIVLILFYRNKKQLNSIMIGVLTLVFLLPFYMYFLEGNYSEDVPYFLQSLVGGLLTGLTIMIVEYLKYKQKQ
ncbi:MAG: hypothetical protein AAF600_21850 [Bacteroidota bacterium]